MDKWETQLHLNGKRWQRDDQARYLPGGFTKRRKLSYELGDSGQRISAIMYTIDDIKINGKTKEETNNKQKYSRKTPIWNLPPRKVSGISE